MKKEKKQAGIRLSVEHEKQTGNSGRSGSQKGAGLFFMRTLLLWFLAAAWCNSFLGIFPVHMKTQWLYLFLLPSAAAGVFLFRLTPGKRLLGLSALLLAVAGIFFGNPKAVQCVNLFANAYLRVHASGGGEPALYREPAVEVALPGLLSAVILLPLLLFWCRTLVRNKGKLSVFLTLLLPSLLAAVEGYFPSVREVGILVLAAGIYFSVCGTGSARELFSMAVPAATVLLVLCLLSVAASERLETVKTVKNGAYLKTRAFVQEQVIQKLEDFTGNPPTSETKKKEEAKEKRKENEEREKEQQTETGEEIRKTDTASENAASLGAVSKGAMQDLKDISAFAPAEGMKLTVKIKEQPLKTVYVPEVYGGVYDGNSWSQEPLGDEVLPEYTQYPQNLKHLLALCEKEKPADVEAASRFIQREFEENTEYDYTPGPTPDKQDFAEYFLFENKKGFCVHFATTATLLYRMSGYTARYAQGFAIPASAFSKQADGTYEAKITGEMGHAWCETYENGWTVREHTLPYRGEATGAVPPASDSTHNEPAQTKAAWKILCSIVGFFCAAGVVSGFLVLQSVFRRRKKKQCARRYRQGKGILEIYSILYEIARFQGMCKTEPLSGESFEQMKKYLPEIPAEEWKWIQAIVWQTMFGANPADGEMHKKFCQLAGAAAEQIRRAQSGWQKIKFQYIKCLW